MQYAARKEKRLHARQSKRGSSECGQEASDKSSGLCFGAATNCTARKPAKNPLRLRALCCLGLAGLWLPACASRLLSKVTPPFSFVFLPFSSLSSSDIPPTPTALTTIPLHLPAPVAMSSSSSNVVGVHYRVGKKIGEGSFGVIFEGTNLLNNQQVAIKFVCFA
jgi:hypothetical protein